MSERGAHLAVARARSAGAVGSPPVTSGSLAAVTAVVHALPDPELPVITIGDLGMVHAVDLDDAGIRVTILPTFIGCPAIDVLASAIAESLAPFARSVTVTTAFDVPWTSDRITEAGRRSLEAAGIAPPADPSAVRCPYCRSTRVVMDNVFGPTQCRSLFYCRDCRQPFEAMKPV